MSKKDKKKDRPPSDAELLGELATLDDVTAYIPTANDHRDGTMPQWCELLLEIKRDAADDNGPGEWPCNYRIPLRRHDGELIIEVLDDVLHPARGGGSADKMWLDLDDCIERIMKRVNKNKSPHDEDRGEALGITRALARLVLPHEDFEDAQEEIKGIAMDRYSIRNGHRNGA